MTNLILIAFTVFLVYPSLLIKSYRDRYFDVAFLIFLVFLFSVFLGFRSLSSGADTYNYHSYYLSFIEGGVREFKFEPLFYLINKGFSFFLPPVYFIYFLTAVQCILIVAVCFKLKIKSKLFAFIAFVAFLPGLDMMTNGLRQGLASYLGMYLLVFLIDKPKFYRAVLALPIFIHYSYVLMLFGLILRVFVNKFEAKKFCYILSCMLFFAWGSGGGDTLVNLLLKLPFSDNYLIFAAIKYLTLQDGLFSDSVKAYFAALSLLLTGIYFLHGQLNSIVQTDKVFNLLFSVSLVGNLLYSAVFFSEYSYRFFYVFYPIQALTFAYFFSKYVNNFYWRALIFAILLMNILITYSTNTFLEMDLISVL